MPPDLEDWIGCIRDPDAMTFEHAFHGERPTGPDVVARLLTEMRRSSDWYTRGKFVELLGEMGDESVVSALVAELTHPNQNVRQATVTALRAIGCEEAVRAVEKYKAERPAELAEPFQGLLELNKDSDSSPS